jgi:hypothetical protein
MSEKMNRTFVKTVSSIVLGLSLTALLFNAPAPLKVAAQQPTGSIPTVTGTPSGPVVTNTFGEQINVRSGPSSWQYPTIGVLLPGEVVPALGRSPGGAWIMIAYPGVPGGVGWVYAPLVSLSPGALPIIDPPPTPTLIATQTLDPTLVAAYIVPATATRLPTFTPPAPLIIPTYVVESDPGAGQSLPMGLVILGLALIGGFGSLITFLRGR